MAEAAGVVIGALSLASLFTTCLECFNLVEAGRSYSRDLSLLSVKYEVEKTRLLIWGEAARISVKEVNYGNSLDKPWIEEIVRKIMLELKLLFDDTKSFDTKYGLKLTDSDPDRTHLSVLGGLEETFEARLSNLQMLTRAKQKTTKFRSKACWAIHDKKKFSCLVEDVRQLVDGLNDVTPDLQLRQQKMVKDDMSVLTDAEDLRMIREACAETHPDWSEAANSEIESEGRAAQNDQYIHEWINTNTYEYSPRSTDSVHAELLEALEGDDTNDHSEDIPEVFQGSQQAQPAISPKAPIKICPSTIIVRIMVKGNDYGGSGKNKPLHLSRNPSRVSLEINSQLQRYMDAPNHSKAKVAKARIYCSPTYHGVCAALAIHRCLSRSETKIRICYSLALIEDWSITMGDALDAFTLLFAHLEQSNESYMSRLCDFIDFDWTRAHLGAIKSRRGLSQRELLSKIGRQLPSRCDSVMVHASLSGKRHFYSDDPWNLAMREGLISFVEFRKLQDGPGDIGCEEIITYDEWFQRTDGNRVIDADISIQRAV